jgi:hypothetical protein
MMITGAHAIIYSKDADADRAFLRDVLELDGIDVGGGWLIFGLPPSEVAVHPAEKNDRHELYLLCEDVEAFVSALRASDIECTEVSDQGWGLLTTLTLPGGGKLGVYQPRHARPEPAPTRALEKKRAPRASKPKKAAKKAQKKVAKKAGKKRKGRR